MINRISIKNFKQFKEINIEGLSRINLISGKNSTGKTSILEALFMFYDRTSPDLTIKNLTWRGINSIHLQPQMMWHHLFNNFEIEKNIDLFIDDSGHTERAIIESGTTQHADINNNINNSINNLNNQSDNQPLHCLRTKYYNGTRSVGSSELIIAQQNFQLKLNNVTPPRKQVAFFHTNIKGNAKIDCERFGTLDLESRTSELIDILQEFDNRIKSISIIPHGDQSYMYVDIGLKKKIPIYMMGEGLSKIMSLALTMLTSKDSIICIDEIENGLHYSLFPNLWKNLDSLANKTRCQLFITTHSYDCINGLSKYLESLDDNERKFTYIRLDKVDTNIIPKIYKSSMIKLAVDSSWEIR